MTWRRRKRRRKGGGADEGPWGGGGGIQIQKSRHGVAVVHGVVVVGMVLSNGRMLGDAAAAAAVRGCCGLHTTYARTTTARRARQSLRPFDQPPMPQEGGGEAGGSDAAAAALVFSSLRMVGLGRRAKPLLPACFCCARAHRRRDTPRPQFRR